MQTTKKVLLSLICIFSACLGIEELFTAILNVINPPWYVGDTGINIIFSWIVTVAFIFAFISSLCWITNVGKGFWLWKLPALLILPLSIPFLIIDFIESRKSKEVISKTTNEQNGLTLLWVIFGINLAFGIVVILVSIREIFWNFILNYIAKSHHLDIPNGIDLIISGIGIIIGLILIISSIFLVINNYHPKKVFEVLSWFGFPISWFYLLLKTINQKESHYFFKKNTTNSSTQQILVD